MSIEAYIPGATAVGVVFKDGVVLAAEKRVALGTFIMSRGGKKVFPITPNTGAACAGMMADMQVLTRNVQAIVKLREMDLRRRVSANSVTKLMSVIMFERRMFPLLTQVILGGVDEEPSIFVLDPLGSVIPDKYACIGSGTELAIGVLESEYKDGMTEKQAKDLVLKAIKASTQRDSSSGDGVDILVITREGSREEAAAF
ncbi:MAG: proteasome subunit beta [Nitrososphaerota archaeon]|nr:proteasome subunit beta [Nitrososphaerota archaeon]MDG6939605.1 proteasome subunit beta [Nitrososphaerota archaeon]